MRELDHDQLEIRAIPWETLAPDDLPADLEGLCDGDEASQRLAAYGIHADVVPPSVAAATASPSVSNGVYLFTAQGDPDPTHLLAVANGTTSVVAQTQFLYDARIEGPELLGARDTYRRWLEEVKGAVLPPRFSAGELVRDKTGRGLRVQHVIASSYATKYRVELSPGVESDVWEEDLEPMAPGSGGPQQWIERRPGTHRDAARLLTLAKLSGDLTDTVYSHHSGTFLFRAYQFRPVLRLLGTPRRRLLIADEVGLGKTVEAGLIWNELESRASLQAVAARRPAPGFRTLVVCPAALVGKWQEEMRNRFGRKLTNLDAAGLRTLTDLLRDQHHDEPFAGVVSLPRLRARKFIEALQQYYPRFDLVIVDEAHHLRNQGTASYRAAEFLEDWADAFVFLSATPLNLGQRDLFNLVQLLDEANFRDWGVFQNRLEPNQYLNLVSTQLANGAARNREGRAELAAHLDKMEDATVFGSEVTKAPGYQRVRRLLASPQAPTQEEIATGRRELAELNALSGVLTRTRKVDVPEPKALRDAQDIEVRWSDEEQKFYDAVYALCVHRARGRAVNFSGQMWLRQAASCIPAMQDVLRRRTADGTIGPDDLAAAAAELTAADPNPDGELSAGTLAEQDTDLGSAHAFAAMTAALSADSKADVFLGLLDRLRAQGLNQVMVFSSFVPTVEYLQQRVNRHGISCRAIHGGITTDLRDQTIREFRERKFDVLILSEVGSEGLDFEFCNALVNYDLPWNPMRVEQRIGRLDRFGQQHEKILIYNMSVPGTIETDIFLRLYNRIGVFQDSVGELEPIMQGLARDAADLAVDPDLTPEERNQRLDQLVRGEENKRQDLVAIRDSEQSLLGIDDLLIKDFEPTNPGRGRYVGPAEIHLLVAEFFESCGHGRISDAGDGTVRIDGDRALSHLVLTAQSAGAWKHTAGEDTAGRVDGRNPYYVALTSEAATLSGHRLLNLRHPLVRTAHWYLDQRRADMPRFSALRVPGLAQDKVYLVILRSLSSVGVRPRRELWGVAVDVNSGRVAQQVPDIVLTELARGSFEQWSGPIPFASESLVGLLEKANSFADRIEHSQRKEYAAHNEYLVGTRTREVESEFAVKIDRDRMQAQRSDDPRTRQMFAGKAEANERRRIQQLAVLRAAGEFSFNSTTVALLLAGGI